MRKIIFLSMLFFLSIGVRAQGSVTLYGIVDAGMTYNSNARSKTQYSVSGGNMSANRFGLKGVEDLGGGLKSIFVLENGFNSVNGTLGQGGAIFGRQAYVGLSSDIGTVTLGRQYLSSSYVLGDFASGADWAARGAGYGNHPGSLDDLDGTERANQAIKFTSADYHGLQFGATYTLGGTAGDFTRDEILSAGARYTNGPFSTAAGYFFAKRPNFSLFGNNPNSATESSASASNISSPVFSGYASSASLRMFGVAASYQVASVTVGGIYTETRFNDVGATAVNGAKPASQLVGTSPVFRTMEVNLKYRLSPALFAGISYAYTLGSTYPGKDAAKYNQVNIALDYSLSRATDLYAVALHQLASGTDSTGRAAVANLAFATPSSSNQQTIVLFGVRHLF